MLYLTRHLEALRDIVHGSDLVPAGQRLHTTEIDANYYVGRKMAKDVPADAPAEPAPVASPVVAPAAEVLAEPLAQPEPEPVAATRVRRTYAPRTPPAEA